MIHTPSLDHSKVAIVVVGTHSYLDPLEVSLRRILSAVNNCKNIEHHLILITDKKSEKRCDKITKNFSSKHIVGLDLEENGKHYDKDRQILIATLQSTGFELARSWGCDFLWSVEADVLVPHNALSISMQMLDFDDGYYDVAFVTYPSQGGGSFLGGHGSYTNPIAEDFLPHERQLPKKLKLVYDECNKRLEDEDFNHKKEYERLHRLREKIKKYPPTGNVFKLNGEKWRRRGWLDNSHAGIGRGAVIETDWTGLGCTLMSKKAALLAHFDGYDGGGTQDLYLNWHRWHPAGLRFCCITHTVCDHVVRDDKAKNGLVTLKSYHETQGEALGHLRYRKIPFHKFT